MLKTFAEIFFSTTPVLFVFMLFTQRNNKVLKENLCWFPNMYDVSCHTKDMTRKQSVFLIFLVVSHLLTAEPSLQPPKLYFLRTTVSSLFIPLWLNLRWYLLVVWLTVLLAQHLASSQKQCQGREASQGNEMELDTRRQRQDLRAEWTEGKQWWSLKVNC